MEETIKGIEVIAYKGMNSDMTCRDFKYELGKSYKTDKVKFCNCGFHACLNPLDVLDYYYPSIKSRYFKVKLSGEITKCSIWDTNVAATEITILEEIAAYEIIKTTEWWKNENVIDLLYFSDGFARVQRGDTLYNYIDKQGKILLNEWFEWVDDFHDGFAIVQREDKLYNLIDTKGNYSSDEWFNCADNFSDGLARVKRKDKWNFIDKKGNYLSDEWFNWADNFYDGLARVKRRNNEWNFIDKKGKILSEQWFNWVCNFCDEFARVQRKDKWNFIDKKGNYLSDEWFNWADNFYDGLARVKRANGEWCKIDKTGKLIKILQ